jgi:hypothetical protein
MRLGAFLNRNLPVGERGREFLFETMGRTVTSSRDKPLKFTASVSIHVFQWEGQE